MEIKPGPGRAALVEMLAAQSRKRVEETWLPGYVGAEIGVQAGEYSEALLRAGVRRLILVDLWAQQKNYFDIANVHDAHHASNLRETISRMSAFPFRSTIYIGMSHEMADRVAPASLDFIYIDANHHLDSVRLDLAAWVPKVLGGGIISGHDFLDSENCCGSEFGVKTAVMEHCEANGISELFVCSDEPFPNWYFIKP